MTYQTEDQIERMVERRTDSLDAEFMAAKIGEPEYARRLREISASADACYRALKHARRTPAPAYVDVCNETIGDQTTRLPFMIRCF